MLRLRLYSFQTVRFLSERIDLKKSIVSCGSCCHFGTLPQSSNKQVKVLLNDSKTRPVSTWFQNRSNEIILCSDQRRWNSFNYWNPECKVKYSQDTGPGDVSVKSEETQEDFGNFVREICAISGVGHHVLVIQPDIKTGSRRYVMTTRELKLAETCALVKTLPGWKVVEKRIVRTAVENTKYVFGSGNFEALVCLIRGMKNVSAVVLGIDRLTGLQTNVLQQAWGVPVFDRYTVVLHIFKDHAQSPEAKLQVALAEVPYIRSRLLLIHSGFNAGVANLVGGSNPMLLDRRRELLQRHEVKLKKSLEKLHTKRQEIREKRQRNSIPTVAVVGYTNAGKTTLIKAITEDLTLTPENHLFATLDVTSHEGRVGHMMKVTFIDTVGFISDMPTSLLDAFRATLDDAMMADLVLHVRDASHPDKRLQVISVHKTLAKMLTENQMENMIEVYNKVDLLSQQELEELDKDILHISAVTGQGFPDLGATLQTGILAATDLMQKTFRIPNSEPILEWLHQESAIKSAFPDPRDEQYLIVKVIISKPAYGKFKARFTRRHSQLSALNR